MINVGVIGLGSMGLTHLDVYSKIPGVKVVAIADLDPDRLSGKTRAAGNIEGQAKGGLDYASVKKYTEGMDLIKDKDVDLVDVCLITPLHLEYGLAALKRKKHLLVEKPLGRTFKDAKRLAAAAEKAATFSMCAMCMRFWPGWTWLKTAVAEQRYGKVLAATFRRVASHPGGPFYSDGVKSGGAILDLHIHDTDFVNHLFGLPASVKSVGYTKVTGETDHVVTHYDYGSGGPMVVAEGGWVMAPGFGFSMAYAVNFERATAVFDLANAQPLRLMEPGKEPAAVALEAGMGYDHEIAYFVDCVAKGQRPTTVTLGSAADSVRIVEAEVKSVKTGRAVKVK